MSETSPAMERVGRRRKRRKHTDLKTESRYISNLLTMARVALILPVLLLMDSLSPRRAFFAMLVYLVASFTDFLDGWFARRRREISVLGKFLDPLADKLMVTSVLVYLTAMGRIPAWLVVGMLARELAVTGLRAIAVSEGLVISASDSGKQKTALQMVGTICLLIHYRYPILGSGIFDRDGLPIALDFHWVGVYVMYLALVMSTISAVEYFVGFVRAVQKSADRANAQLEAKSAAASELKTPVPKSLAAKPVDAKTVDIKAPDAKTVDIKAPDAKPPDTKS